METSEMQLSEAIPRPRRGRWLLPVAALLLGALLLATWMGVMAKSNEPDVLSADPDWDFAISKVAVPSIFTVGTNNRYRIDVSYITTSTLAVKPIIEDILPTGVSNVGVSTDATKWDCSTSTPSIISCAFIGTLPNSPASLPSIYVTIRIPTDAPPSIDNIAKLISADLPGDSNDETPIITTPIESADIAISKTRSPSGLITINTDVDFTIVITNNGPSEAHNVVVKDNLSTDFNYTLVSTTTGSVNFSPVVSPTLMEWKIPSMNKGDVHKLILRADPQGRANGKLFTNTATVSSYTSDWKPENNSATVSFLVGGVEINKAANVTEAYTGQRFNFTLNVKNISNTALSITVNDYFTQTLDILQATRSINGGAPVGVSISRNFLNTVNLNVNQTATYVFWVRANKNIKDTEKIVTNRASASWVFSGTTLNRLSNIVEVLIKPSVDLQIGKTDGKDTAFAGTTITYTISLTNTGSLTATNVTITDTFSNNLTFVAVKKDGLSLSNVYSNTATTPNILVWKLLTPLVPGQKITWRISGKVASTAPVGSSVTNTVLARLPSTSSAPFIDQDLSNNVKSDTDQIILPPVVSLSLKKSVTPSEAKPGESLTFKIEVKNTGTSTVVNARVTDTFVSFLELGTLVATKGTISVNSTTRSITWSIGTLVPNEVATITIPTRILSSYTVTKAETHTNTALLNWDPNQSLTVTVKFRVLPSSTLPATGGGGEDIGLIPLLALLGGGLLGLLGLGLLAYGLWRRKRHPLRAGLFTRTGALMILGALILGFTGFSLRSSGQQTALSPPPIQASPTSFAVAEATLPPVPPTGGPPAMPTPTLPQFQPQPSATAFLDLWPSGPTPTPLTLPEYPIPTPPPAATPLAGVGEADSSAITRIQIPAINLDTVVKFVPYDGKTWLIGGLRMEVAWMGNTSWPGLGGNTGLAGHVDLADGSDGPFRDLDVLKPGDRVVLYTEKKVYTYQVREQAVVEPYDMYIIDPTEKPQLTLITCTDWDTAMRVYLKRLVVFADLIDVQPISP